MTIKEIAKKAKVSTATVSRIINHKEEGYSAETREKVLQVIEELNYSPNRIARGMVTKKTFTIGLVIRDIENPFFPTLVRGIEKVANENGYFILLCNTDGDINREKQYISFLKEKRVDGIIITTCNGNDEQYINEITSGDIKFVFVDEIAKGVKSVTVDNYQGGFEATKYLLELGHKKIACIAGPQKSLINSDRVNGYTNALRDSGLEVDEDLILYGSYQANSGFVNMQKILELNKEITAVFCTNDFNATGAYNALNKNGLKVPENISIVGFDDIYEPLDGQFGFTTIAQPIIQLGVESAKMLIDLINDKEVNKNIVLSPKLVIKDSTKEID